MNKEAGFTLIASLMFAGLVMVVIVSVILVSDRSTSPQISEEDSGEEIDRSNQPTQISTNDNPTQAVPAPGFENVPEMIVNEGDSIVEPESPPPPPEDSEPVEPVAPPAPPEPEPEPEQSSCASDPNPVFTADITDLTKISKITPSGSVNPDDGFVTAHSYIWIAGSTAVPIYAPVDMTLGMGGLYIEPPSPAHYILFFGVSCEVSIKIDHFDSPIEQIKNVLPNIPKINDSRTDDPSSSIKFKAGDLLGYTSGNVESHNWDFGVYNETKPNFISDVDPNADCPYDYFTEDKKTVYYNLFVGRTGGGSPPTTYCK